jgi:ribosomal protein L13
MRFLTMPERKRIHYNTTLDVELLKQLKFLSVEENKRHNELLEEAIRDLLKKRGKKIK